MVEIVQSAWGDWWIVADGEPVAVHLRGSSNEATRAFAAAHARRLFPGRPLALRRFAGTRQPDRPRAQPDTTW